MYSHWLSSKDFTCNARDPNSTPGSGRSPWRGHGNPLLYSCLVNPTDRGTWQATVHRITESEMTEVIERASTHSTYTCIYNAHEHLIVHLNVYPQRRLWLWILFWVVNYQKPKKWEVFILNLSQWQFFNVFEFNLQFTKQPHISSNVCDHLIESYKVLRTHGYQFN